MNNPNQIIKTWNDAYLLDIPVIDEQHKKLFEIYDELSHIVSDNEPQNDFNIKQILIRLEEYTKFHFNTEEKYMTNIKCEGLEQHKNEHRLFENKLADWQLAFEYKNTMLAKNILNFIKKWLVSHIMESDTYYKDKMQAYFAANPI